MITNSKVTSNEIGIKFVYISNQVPHLMIVFVIY
jgi:hypothetical protein